MASRRAAAVAAAASVLPPISSNNTATTQTNPALIGSAINSGIATNNGPEQALLVATSHHVHHPHHHSHNSVGQHPPTQHDFHPAYRIPGYMEHLYSLQRGSPTSSFHGRFSINATRAIF